MIYSSQAPPRGAGISSGRWCFNKCGMKPYDYKLYRYIDLKGFNEIGVGPCVDQPQKRALNIEFMIPMVSCFRLTWFLRHGHINC